AFSVLEESAPQISPDGKHFALIRSKDGRPIVAIYEVDAPSKPPEIVTSEDSILDGLLWVKNDVLVVYAKRIGKLGVWENSNLVRTIGDARAILISDKKMVQLSAYIEIDDIDLDDPNMVFASYEDALYRLNVRVGGRPV